MGAAPGGAQAAAVINELRRAVVGVKVLSQSDGNLLVCPYYDTRLWPMFQDDGKWYGYPGLLDRMALASMLEELINGALAESDGQTSANVALPITSTSK